MATEEFIIMNKKEILRLQIIEKFSDKMLKQGEASMLLGIGCRQVRGMLKACRQQGAKSLISKKCGKASDNRICESVKQNVLALTKKNMLILDQPF